MKKYLIILFLWPFLLFGQVGQWDSTEAIIYPTDTTGKIVLAVGDTLYLINVDTTDANASINYINRRSATKMIYDFDADASDDTIPAACLFQNYDFDSLFYSRISSKIINSDSTINLPERITEIEVYASATDRMSYFDVSFSLTPSMITVCSSGCDQTTIDAAVVAASNDTIVVYSGNYTENNGVRHNLRINKDNIKIFGLGNCIIKASSSANEVVRFETSTSNSSINCFTIDAENAYNQCFLNLTIGNVSNCFIKNAITNQISASHQDTIQNNVFTGNATTCILGHNTYINENYFNADATQYIYSLNSSGTRHQYYNRFMIDNSMSYAEYNRSNGDYKVKFNEYEINNTLATALIYFYSGGYIGTFYYKGNEIIDNNSTSVPIIYQANGSDFSGNYTKNIFNYPTQGNSGIGILVQDQSGVLIDSNSFSATSENTYRYIYYNASSATSHTTFTVNNNSFDIKNKTGYGIRIGEESTGVGDNTIQGIVTGNYIHGHGRAGNSLHSILIGFQNNFILKYNRCDSTGYGAVLKASTLNNDSEQIFGNIFSNCQFGYRIKGMDSLNIYNCTIDSCSNGIYISDNDAVGTSQGQTLINNIISNCDNLITVADANSDIDTSNYNLFYNGLLNGGTFATWQGLGYDANSYNSNPNFKSSTQLWSTSGNAINNGLYLGNPYDSALNINSIWPDNINLIQVPNGLIDIGAYSVGTSTITTNGFIVVKNGLNIILNR